jgi:glycosyltransferase involved in cell wall biosynthesis
MSGTVSPEISVILAVADAEESVGREVKRIAACLRERNANFEIIAVNDGSRDNSFAVLRLLALEIPQLRLCLAESAGRVFVRGVAEARGSIVVLREAGSTDVLPAAIGWDISRIAAGRRAVVLRGRCIVVDRMAGLPAILRTRGRGELYERSFERAAAELFYRDPQRVPQPPAGSADGQSPSAQRDPLEIVGTRTRRRAGFLAPVLRLLAA